MSKGNAQFARCQFCGRLDPWNALPCYCRKTSMETPEGNTRLFYEHHTDGHPFGVPGCPVCSDNKNK